MVEWVVRPGAEGARPRCVRCRIGERIVTAALAGGQTRRQVAENGSASGLTTVEKLLRLWPGSLAPKPVPGRSRAVDAAGEERLRAALRDRPDATLAELREECGLSCSLSAVHRALGRMGYTRKKRPSTPSNAIDRT